jgi:hypothetical protein
MNRPRARAATGSLPFGLALGLRRGRSRAHRVRRAANRIGGTVPAVTQQEYADHVRIDEGGTLGQQGRLQRAAGGAAHRAALGSTRPEGLRYPGGRPHLGRRGGGQGRGGQPAERMAGYARRSNLRLLGRDRRGARASALLALLALHAAARGDLDPLRRLVSDPDRASLPGPLQRRRARRRAEPHRRFRAHAHPGRCTDPEVLVPHVRGGSEGTPEGALARRQEPLEDAPGQEQVLGAIRRLRAGGRAGHPPHRSRRLPLVSGRGRGPALPRSDRRQDPAARHPLAAARDPDRTSPRPAAAVRSCRAARMPRSRSSINWISRSPWTRTPTRPR